MARWIEWDSAGAVKKYRLAIFVFLSDCEWSLMLRQNAEPAWMPPHAVGSLQLAALARLLERHLFGLWELPRRFCGHSVLRLRRLPLLF